MEPAVLWRAGLRPGGTALIVPRAILPAPASCRFWQGASQSCGGALRPQSWAGPRVTWVGLLLPLLPLRPLRSPRRQRKARVPGPEQGFSSVGTVSAGKWSDL